MPADEYPALQLSQHGALHLIRNGLQWIQHRNKLKLLDLTTGFSVKATALLKST